MATKKRTDLQRLAAEAHIATRAVVQIHAQGFSDENIRSILDPRFCEPTEWTGSGFFIKIDGERGYILTNAHVARNATTLQVMTLHTSEELFDVEVVGIVERMDPDIALLKMPPKEQTRFKEIYGGEIPYLEFADSSFVDRGTNVKAIGYPLGMAEPNISGGEISNFIAGDDVSSERLVTDAAINPGNSGGPALIDDARVVGLNTAIIVNANNIGFITPINYAKILIELMAQEEAANLSDYGAKFQKNSENNATHLRLEKAQGVIITELLKGGFLETAGLVKHDVLFGINNFRFDRHGIVMNLEAKNYRKRTIYDVIRLIPPGTEVTVHYLRDGKRMSVKSKALHPPFRAIGSKPIISKRRHMFIFGMILQELSFEIIEAFSQVDPHIYLELVRRIESKKPLLCVTFVEQGTPCEDIAIDMGDLIAKVNDHEITSLAGLEKTLHNLVEKGERDILFEFIDGKIAHFDLEELKAEKFTIFRSGSK